MTHAPGGAGGLVVDGGVGGGGCGAGGVGAGVGDGGGGEGVGLFFFFFIARYTINAIIPPITPPINNPDKIEFNFVRFFFAESFN